MNIAGYWPEEVRGSLESPVIECGKFPSTHC